MLTKRWFLTHCTSKTLLSLALSRISFLKTNEKIQLYEQFDTVKELSLCSLDDLSMYVKRLITSNQWKPGVLESLAMRDIQIMEKYNIRFVPYWDEAFPPLLREIYDPPFMLFWRGSLPSAEKPSVAVVGTRLASTEGMKAAYKLGFELGSLGIPVVSGLARGIDSQAHSGNIGGGGKSVAVLACGVDSLYPKSNAHLASRLLESGGCIISEYPPFETAAKWHFVQRNRLISGFARTVVVCEAPEKSGALITAQYALDQGRDVAIHRVALGSPVGEGAARFAEEGAAVIEKAEDILRIWNDEISTVLYMQAAKPVIRGSMKTHSSIGAQLAFDLGAELDKLH